MSKSQESSDVFAVYEQNVGSNFSNVEKTIPTYNLAVTNLQQEYLRACQNVVASALNIQKEFAKKSGMNVSVPDAVLNVIKDTNKQVVNAYSVQNQSVLTIIDAVQQSIKALNENTKTFADMNKNMIQSWIQSFTPTNN